MNDPCWHKNVQDMVLKWFYFLPKMCCKASHFQNKTQLTCCQKCYHHSHLNWVFISFFFQILYICSLPKSHFHGLLQSVKERYAYNPLVILFFCYRRQILCAPINDFKVCAAIFKFPVQGCKLVYVPGFSYDVIPFYFFQVPYPTIFPYVNLFGQKY